MLIQPVSDWCALFCHQKLERGTDSHPLLLGWLWYDLGQCTRVRLRRRDDVSVERELLDHVAQHLSQPVHRDRDVHRFCHD